MVKLIAKSPTLLVLFVLVVVVHAPWRLLLLAGEVALVRPGVVRMPSGQNNYWLVQDLSIRLNELGWEVRYIPMDPSQYGMTQPDAHLISINETLSWNARYATLAHEAGHTLQPYWMNKRQGEAFAEGVSYLVTGDSAVENARYLAHSRIDTLLTLLTEWREIYHAATLLEDR